MRGWLRRSDARRGESASTSRAPSATAEGSRSSRAEHRPRTDRSRVAGITAVSLVLGGVVAASVLYDGVATADVELNDGGVWVTNPNESQLARLNYPVQMLDAGLTAASTHFDVLQEGGDVFLVDEAAGLLQRVDPASVSTSGSVNLPAQRQTGLGGDVLAVLDTGSGILRTAEAGAYGALADDEADPQAQLGADAHLAVGTDGTTYGLSTREATLVGIEPGQDADAEPVDLGVGTGAFNDATVDVTAVGENPAVVVLGADGALQVLQPGSEPIDLTGALPPATTVAVQHPSAGGNELVLATAESLVRVPLTGGEPMVVPAPAPGPPARPVRQGACVHAAWAGSEPTYLHQCGDGDPTTAPVTTEVAQPQLVFRTNRDLVVLNDVIAGTVWLPEDNMEVVENWEDVTPPDDPSQEEEESQQELRDEVPLDRDRENRPPATSDDRFGVRPGSTTALEVLGNDTDPDGDLLTVSSYDSPPASLGTIDPVLGDRALQVQVPEGASGTASIGYTASDGRGGQTPATASIQVVPDSVNNAPEQLREITMTLAAGSTGSVNVLTDVRDPDGDELLVTDAAWSSDDEVRFTPDGVLTFVDSGTATGHKEVRLTVSDSRASAEVTVDVEVLPATPLPPAPVFDYHRATVGEEIVVEPIANDTDPNDETLRLANVQETAEATVVPDYDAGSFRFSGDRAMTYYLTYIVVDDAGQSATGLVRIDVVEPADAAPVAVRDTALLPAGGSVLVDVLGNDTDPSGRLLAVQQIDVPPESGLTVAVLEHRVLKISAQGALPGSVRFSYTVSNGAGTAEGEVVVMPLAAEGTPQPPVAERDTANVRAGDFLTIPVLQNDTHPDGAELHLVGLAEEPPDRQGRFFVSGETVRFRAPAQPQTVSAVYRIADEDGNEASAQITVYVQADDGESNSAPQPEPLETRAFGGERVRIQVPMFGIDPDGDSVQLLGAEEGPTLGRIVEAGPGYLDYEAYAHSVGTDEFTYAVRDRMGLVAGAPVRVGVVPPPESNSRPQAVDDLVEARPGRAVEVDVLANDTDPDGDPLYLGGDPFDAVEGMDLSARDNLLEMRTGAAETEFSLGYRVSDQRGGQDTGVLSVRVSHDAELQAPAARDDLVPDADIVGHDAVTVPVLDNDDDPDGTRDALVVDVLDAGEGVSVDGDELRVELLPTRQVVLYSVTDVDGLVGYAFVDVPGTEDTGPVLRTDVDPVTVTTGERIDLALTDHVVAPSGDPVRLTSEDAVSATSSDGSSPVVDATTLTFASADGYVGPAAITFEVTDGATTDEGRRSVLTLPITVEPAAGNSPPTFAGGALEVAPGEPAESLNLRNLSDDPDPGEFNQLAYEIVAVPDGFEASLDGPFLSASVAAEVPRGTVGPIEVSVSDGVNEPVVGTVGATVVPSTRPVPVVNDADLGTVDQGETAAADLLAGAYNPFPEEPLELSSAVVETGQAAVDVSGGEVAVTPAQDYVGRVVVVAEVDDATGDPERRVAARITMDVIGRPGTPAPPRVDDVGDGQVVLTWSAPASNGAPISGYTVAGAGQSWDCATTTCTIDGLTNNAEYTFTVLATNSVGDSEPSGPSAAARPDVRPEAPGVPTVEFGDSQLRIAWAAAATSGSPVESYDVRLSPAVGSGQVSVSGTSHTWTGLDNGTEYRVQVRARNQAPEPSEWSGWSAGQVPAAPPARPAPPVVERVDNAVAEQITASWQAPAANGDAISAYTVTIQRDGAQLARYTVPPGTTSITRDAPAGSAYTVSVAATNKAGDGATSAPSRPVRSFARPDRVGTVTAEATGSDGQVRLGFSAPAANGDPITRYQVNHGSGWQPLPGDKTVTGLSDGTSYTFRVRACNTYCGEASGASGPATPYGPLGQVSLSAQRTADREVTFAWTLPGGNGRDITSAQVRYKDGGGAWTGWRDVSGSSATRGGAWSTTYQAEIRLERADGQARTASASARTKDEPPDPTVAIVRRPQSPIAGGGDRCSGPPCGFIDIAYTDMPPGSYTLNFHNMTDDIRLRSSNNGQTRYLAGSGTFRNSMFWGYPGKRLRVIVEGNGVREVAYIVWPSS